MTIDPTVCQISSTSFIKIEDEGSFEEAEAEILFSTHTVFRISRIQQIERENTNRLWEVHLTLTSPSGDSEMSALTDHLRQEDNSATGLARLGRILVKIEEPIKAEDLFRTLLDNPTTDRECAHYYNELGTVYFNTGEYLKALSFYERLLEIWKLVLPPNHPLLANAHNNIASVHVNTGEYSKALSSYERSLEIYKAALPSSHSNLATSYDNIGKVYYNMGEYSKALSFYEQALEIWKVVLPSNHPHLTNSYNNLGTVYHDMGECSNSLSSYEQALEIMKAALPPNHPLLATCYSSIGAVYDTTGDYSNALSSHEQALQIRKAALHSNHPDWLLSTTTLEWFITTLASTRKHFLRMNNHLKS